MVVTEAQREGGDPETTEVKEQKMCEWSTEGGLVWCEKWTALSGLL
jgi:hypothetical protein